MQVGTSLRRAPQHTALRENTLRHRLIILWEEAVTFGAAGWILSDSLPLPGLRSTCPDTFSFLPGRFWATQLSLKQAPLCSLPSCFPPTLSHGQGGSNSPAEAHAPLGFPLDRAHVPMGRCPATASGCWAAVSRDVPVLQPGLPAHPGPLAHVGVSPLEGLRARLQPPAAGAALSSGPRQLLAAGGCRRRNRSCWECLLRPCHSEKGRVLGHS